MNKIVSPKITALAFSILVLCFAVGFYIVAWSPPTADPPGDNVDAPINVGTDPQAKAGRISATEFYDYNDSSYYANPSGNSRLDSFSLVGGTSLPGCESANRGEIYLLQGGSSTDDKLYFCKRKPDATYEWALMEGRALQGEDTSTTRTGLFFNGAVYNLSTDEGEGSRATAYCGGWYPIFWTQPSFERFCQERGLSFAAWHSGGGVGSGAGCYPKCYWNGSQWVQTGDAYCKDIWLWCENKEVCENGVCCPVTQDCDGDGYTYYFGDCDESCPTCYEGSLEYTVTPDGKDQNCDGIVDNYVTQCGPEDTIYGYNSSCNWISGGTYKYTSTGDPSQDCAASPTCCSCTVESTSSGEPQDTITCRGNLWVDEALYPLDRYKCSANIGGYY